MEHTVLEWIQLIPEEIGRRWLSNLTRSGQCRYGYLSSALCETMGWHRTPEGRSYWRGVYEIASSGWYDKHITGYNTAIGLRNLGLHGCTLTVRDNNGCLHQHVAIVILSTGFALISSGTTLYVAINTSARTPFMDGAWEILEIHPPAIRSGALALRARLTTIY